MLYIKQFCSLTTVEIFAIFICR